MLENVIKLEKSLWNSYVEYEGVDKDMANMYAGDRNDVNDARLHYAAGRIPSLKKLIDHMDTCIRDGLILAFAADLGADWVRENLGWNVR